MRWGAGRRGRVRGCWGGARCSCPSVQPPASPPQCNLLASPLVHARDGGGVRGSPPSDPCRLPVVQCSLPLPGLRTQEICCRGAGVAWGVHECQPCDAETGEDGAGKGGRLQPRGPRGVVGGRMGVPEAAGAHGEAPALIAALPTPANLPALGQQDAPCPKGFQRSNGSCVDVDECTQQSCAGGRCENTPGSYRCVCPAGYQLGPPGTGCTDIDECAQSPRPCAPGRCENTPGGYRCACPRGYQPGPDGTQCVGKRGRGPAHGRWGQRGGSARAVGRVHACMGICEHTCIGVCACTGVYGHTCISVCACTGVSGHARVAAWACTGVCAHANIHSGCLRTGRCLKARVSACPCMHNARVCSVPRGQGPSPWCRSLSAHRRGRVPAEPPALCLRALRELARQLQLLLPGRLPVPARVPVRRGRRALRR
uniref:Latent transforming growth factor beta binding protein 4 n=1 Tax=Apteryx owenii TaxID=8824 RepID=A0A8B9P9F2_APTOW